MNNSPKLPIGAIVLGILLFLLILPGVARVGAQGHLSELEIGLAAWGFTLILYGAQGLISYLVEGAELRPGRAPPHLTDPLSVAIVVSSVLLLVSALLLAYGIVADWPIQTIGLAAGFGCIILALLLVFYKEAFVGEEARFDVRDDGTPW